MRLSLLMCASLLWAAGASAFNLKSVTAQEDEDDNSLLRGRILGFLDRIEDIDFADVVQAGFPRDEGKGSEGKGSEGKGSEGKGAEGTDSGSPGGGTSGKGSKGTDSGPPGGGTSGKGSKGSDSGPPGGGTSSKGSKSGSGPGECYDCNI